MTISLSSHSIANGIYALAALDQAGAHGLESYEPSSLLCPDRMPALNSLIESECAMLVTALFPLVEDCNVSADNEPDDADRLMLMELPAADLLPHGMGVQVRRAIEQILVLRVLIAVYSFSGKPVADLSARADALMRSLRDVLTPPDGHPSVTPFNL